MDDKGNFNPGYAGFYGRPVPSAATSADQTPVRSGSPESGNNPFASPDASRPVSSLGSSNDLGNRLDERGQRYFHSRRVTKEEIARPWLDKKKHPKEKWVTILPIIGLVIGLGISGFLVYDGVSSVVHNTYCSVLDDDFSKGFNTDVWEHEVQVGGFGNGEFAMTTTSEDNVFVEDGNLVIKATLQDADLVEKDNTIDLLKDGTCTADTRRACVAATNTTAGNASIVPPARSGRITTKKGATIRYGRVEVTARLPKGDWLWPAIWMMPVRDTYGPWPASGEIDIMESRGNNHTYAQGGSNIMSSALHWGPDPANDAWWRTNNKLRALRGSYADGFHTYGLEWSQKYLFTYVDSRLMQVLYTNFNKPMWDRGGFPQSNANGTRLDDVWSETGHDNSPFDQPFYLILNLAVGGTNGWFEDGQSGKPWMDHSDNAKKDFWNARNQWFPTWKRPQLEVSRVQIWQQCNGNESEDL